MIAAFTGPQGGMTSDQKSALHDLLAGLNPELLHVGDCVGADEEATTIAHALGIATENHPSNLDEKRAHTTGHVREHQPKHPLVRNRDMVDNADVLIGAPTGRETLRSGTWATIRYARVRYARGEGTGTIYLIGIDGTVTED